MFNIYIRLKLNSLCEIIWFEQNHWKNESYYMYFVKEGFKKIIELEKGWRNKKEIRIKEMNKRR